MTFQHLSPEALARVRATAIDLGLHLDGNLEALNTDLPAAFVGLLPTGGNATARLLTTLSRLNTTRVLRSGVVPLEVWLTNALLLSGGRPEELVFREALADMAIDGAVVDADDADMAAVRRHEDGSLEIAIGTDETIDARFLALGVSAAASVGLVQLQRHANGDPLTVAGGGPDIVTGTAWMIAPTLAITNRHVITARLPGETSAESDFDLQARSARVRFDHLSGAAAGPFTAVSAGCVLAALMPDVGGEDLDYALLRLEVPATAGGTPRLSPMRLRPTALLRLDGSPLKERVNLLQYPGGDQMKVGLRDNFVVTATDRRLSYLTDTARGASGAPVCDDLWCVAGLHRGWAAIKGEPLRLWGREIRQENYAVPISRIMADIDDRAPALGDEIRAGQQGLATPMKGPT